MCKGVSINVCNMHKKSGGRRGERAGERGARPYMLPRSVASNARIRATPDVRRVASNISYFNTPGRNTMFHIYLRHLCPNPDMGGIRCAGERGALPYNYSSVYANYIHLTRANHSRYSNSLIHLLLPFSTLHLILNVLYLSTAYVKGEPL